MRSAPATRADASLQRSAYIDNAKALLIILVVFFHLFAISVGEQFPARSLYLMVFTFHMPAFALVSGWLSRSELFTKHGLITVARLAWTYLALTAVNHLYSVVVLGSHSQFRQWIQVPYFGLWFLLSLFWWRVLLALFGLGDTRRAAIISVGAAALIALFAGYLPGEGTWLSVQRTLALFPFFVAGYRLKVADYRVSLTATNAFVSSLVLLVVFAAINVGLFTSRLEPLLFRQTFAEVGGPFASWMGRLVLLAVSGVSVAAFLHLVPRRKLPITALGVTVVSVYGWHALIVRVIKNFNLDFLVDSWLSVALMTAVIVVAFGFGPVARATTLVLTGRRVGVRDVRTVRKHRSRHLSGGADLKPRRKHERSRRRPDPDHAPGLDAWPPD